MNPREFEQLVCEYFASKGFVTQITPCSNDYGIDLFALSENEKVAVQVKMYAGGRKINRQMMMELHGAKDYFDCSKAVIATNGKLLKDAELVAQKLNIEILYIDDSKTVNLQPLKSKVKTFESIWEEHIIPLQGKRLIRKNGESNEVVIVNWGELHRITSNGKYQKIKIEIFKQTVDRLLQDGYITRDEINQNYVGRASSGVILVLSQVPFFSLTIKPLALRYIKGGNS